MSQHAGRITAAGSNFDARFDAADTAVNDALDAAYRTNAGSPYLPTMISPSNRPAAVRITLRTSPGCSPDAG
jgi:hypothetical protein